MSKSFSEIFSKFNPLEVFKSDIRVDLDNPSEAVESIIQMGVQLERARIANRVQSLNVDSFDDICYKSDVLAIVEGESVQEPTVSTNCGQGRKQMPFTWDVYGNPSDGLWKCLICGDVLQLKFGVFGEGALKVHRQNHLDNALIKGENK